MAGGYCALVDVCMGPHEDHNQPTEGVPSTEASTAPLRSNFRPVTCRAEHGPRQVESSATPDSLGAMAARS